MLDSQEQTSPPLLDVTLEVVSSLAHLFEASSPLRQALCREVAREVADLMAVLGIPGQPDAEVVALPEGAAGTRLVQVSVQGRRRRCSDEFLQRVHSYAAGVPIDPQASPTSLLAWLREHGDAPPEAAPPVLLTFFRLAGVGMLSTQPSMLLGPAQVSAYQALLDLGPGAQPLDLDWLHAVLKTVLDQRISIADTQTVARILGEEGRQAQPPEDAAEHLIDALRPEVVEIQVPPGYLRVLTEMGAVRSQEPFALMRDGLFYELGLRFPDFRFVETRHLLPERFGFKINHLKTLPRAGLRPGQCLINDTPGRLGLLQVEGTPTLNPANGNEVSVADAAAHEVAEQAGLASWTPLEYLVLCFSADVREHSGCFVHLSAVNRQLTQLEPTFPVLVQAIKERFSEEQVTRVLRDLVEDEISIRDLRRILERMLDYDYLALDPGQYIIFDDRLPVHPEAVRRHGLEPVQRPSPAYLTASVRSGMKQTISHKYTRGSSTLVVYLIDPEIEQRLSRHLHQDEPLDEAFQTQLIEAIRTEVRTYPSGTVGPVLLTSADLRAFMRALIAPELPRLPVLAYRELAPTLNIQPLARISLGAR